MEVQAGSMSTTMMAQSIAQNQMGAQLINKTIDTMNNNQSGSGNSDYEFQKDVLSAAMSGKGSIINIIA